MAKQLPLGPPPLNPQQIARRAEGTVLFYWLGEKQSYLWAITPQKTSLFTLPPGSEIEAGVKRYRKALGGPQDVLESAEPGRPLALSHADRARTSFAEEGREGFRRPGWQLEQSEFRNSSRVRANAVRPKLALLD